MPIKQINTTLLSKYIDLKNIADDFDDSKLAEISGDLLNGIEHDKRSQKEWLDQMEEALKIARQDMNEKNYPWPKASNVQIPLLLTACIQFNARSAPEVIQGDKIVKVAVMCPDQTGMISEIAHHQGRHMSYQLMNVIKNWKSDTDKLLMCLPLLGTVYRKTYFDKVRKKPRVDLCLPDKVIIDQNISALEDAERVTHDIEISNNVLIERMNTGIYTKYELQQLTASTTENNDLDKENPSTGYEQKVESTYHNCYECHCWLDLDDDDYKEPYIVTIHRPTSKILRIVARYDKKSFIKDGDKIVGIDAINFWTDFHFLPSPDGAFMGLGFGQFLYPLNQATNTITNNLIDAGHLANVQGGFISRVLRIKKGEMPMAPGQWVQVNSPSGVALQHSIMALPVKEPSATLFQLLQFLLEQAREVASINEPMQGQLPPANTPATTVMAVLQQGQKVYSSIFARLYEGFKKEFEKLYELNSKYLKATETYALAEESGTVVKDQYDSEQYGVFPVADPNLSSDTMRFSKMQALLQMKDDPNINEREVIERYVELLRIPQPQKILNPPPPPNQPPPPETQLLMAQTAYLHTQSGKIMSDIEQDAEKLHIDERRLQLEALKAAVDATTEKLNSIIQLAELDMQGGKQAIESAQAQQAILEKMEEQQFQGIGDTAGATPSQPDAMQRQPAVSPMSPQEQVPFRAQQMQPPQGAEQ